MISPMGLMYMLRGARGCVWWWYDMIYSCDLIFVRSGRYLLLDVYIYLGC